jgi:hypothetical protein
LESDTRTVSPASSGRPDEHRHGIVLQRLTPRVAAIRLQHEDVLQAIGDDDRGAVSDFVHGRPVVEARQVDGGKDDAFHITGVGEYRIRKGQRRPPCLPADDVLANGECFRAERPLVVAAIGERRRHARERAADERAEPVDDADVDVGGP